MQTKLICTGAALIGVASYFAYLNYHYVLTGSMFISGIGITILAIAKKDKKDKQIEEIHATVTYNKVIETQPTLLKKPENKQKQLLSETHEKVLELLFQKPTSIENLCKTLNLSREEVKFYLFDLCDNKNMVNHPAPYSTGPEAWLISQKGREYVKAKQGNV